jgi:hypothetical protein
MRQRRISDIIEAIPEEGGARQSSRLPMEAEVTFLHPEGVSGQTLDLNHGGMRVLTDEELTVGQRCIAMVKLPTGSTTHERVKVVWSRRSNRGWEAGLQFAS